MGQEGVGSTTDHDRVTLRVGMDDLHPTLDLVYIHGSQIAYDRVGTRGPNLCTSPNSRSLGEHGGDLIWGRCHVQAEIQVVFRTTR